jgi:prepilin-type processing-associated H-X9-DG protein
LGTPKVIVCPSDERAAATSFTTPPTASPEFPDGTGNGKVSYFVGVGANENYPQSILSGDRNLGDGSAAQNAAYGYSPTSASFPGADITIATNNAAVAFSDKMHQKQGNIALGDGSVQQVSSARFRSELLKNVDPGSYYSSGTPPTIRILFP